MPVTIGRRALVSALGGAAAAWPLAARAQQSERMRRIGVLVGGYAQTDLEGQTRVSAFLNVLQGLGWTDGRNITLEVRWPADDVERAKHDATELVSSSPDVIVVATNPALAELQQLTKAIPIVFAQVSDPIESGFVQGLAHPGGNITGFQNYDPEIGGKWLGLLKEAAPSISRVLMPHDPDSTASVAFVRAAEAVAPSLAVRVNAAGVRDRAEIESAITAFAGEPNGGLIVVPHRIVLSNRDLIIALAARYHLPAIYPFRFFAIAGGLMSYGIDQIEQWRGAARYVDRILRGEKPSELPVQAPTKFELVVNLKVATALGLSIPPALPLRADEVIE
jgi:putative tryptophan/tyrosine transport system substrate-binding protein